MKLVRQPTTLILLALLFAPALLFSQEQPAAKEKPAAKEETAVKEESPQHGSVEFGVRHVWGEVYGRPDLPFTPDVLTSKFNEYGDRRNGFVVRKLQLAYDNILGTKNYVSLQSQSTLYKNQSYLATIGQYGKFKIQFRYDEIPHIYTNTARSLYVQTSPGVFTILPATKQVLQDRSSIVCATAPCTAARLNVSLPGFIASQIVPGENFITPAIQRKAATGLLSWNITAHWNATFLFSREHESGTRPIGLILNSSPSAGASGNTTGGNASLVNQQSPGTGAELPEPINYFNNLFKVMTEYGKKDWGVQVGYTGSFFRNNTTAMVFDNPFATADVAVQTFAPGTSGCPAGTARCSIGAVPSQGQVDLYPDNQAHYLNAAAAFDVGKYVRVMGTVTPGWLRQNDPFLPYSANSQIFFPDSTGALTIPATTLSLLPAPSLNGQKQTLAMNYKAVYSPLKDVEVDLSYRQYDYNNNTPILTLIPILGDTIGANSPSTGQLVPGTASSGSGATEDNFRRATGFNKKNLELTGNWFFTKKSSLKAGYEGEWFDRSRRDAAHSLENSFFGALDLVPHKDLLIRFSGRHQDRKPDKYEDEASEGLECDPAALLAARTAGDFPEVQPCSRRFDEAARLLDRVDALVEYSRDKFTVSAGFQTIQQDFNRRGEGSNSATPLNFLTGAAATTKPYFLYGAINDLAYTYTFDATYAFSPEVSLFAEYAHERYHKRMISRSRTPFATTAPFCSAGGCDSANNDWESTYSDIFNTYSAGVDLFLAKKVYLTMYYSLAAGRGDITSRFLGDPTRLTAGDPDKFVLVGTSAGVSYPESVTRLHEVTAVIKYKLSERLMPKVEYRYQQFDNRDYQTSAMTPYMGCISPATGTLVNGCPARMLFTGATSPNPTFTPGPFYPGFVVGDTSAARYLFMGVDQPSYRVHTLTATLEYRF
jgi:MtrB/PioB family decaheme-associated outer membrane protein